MMRCLRKYLSKVSRETQISEKKRAFVASADLKRQIDFVTRCYILKIHVYTIFIN